MTLTRFFHDTEHVRRGERARVKQDARQPMVCLTLCHIAGKHTGRGNVRWQRETVSWLLPKPNRRRGNPSGLTGQRLTLKPLLLDYECPTPWVLYWSM